MAIDERDILALRNAVENITQILAGRGIEVSQRGARAYVESDSNGVPRRVNLPYIPENATDELMSAIHGFLDHEVAHLLFTDFDVVSKAHRLGKKAANLHNILEDSWIERAMSKKFKGSAHNLGNVGEFFLRKYTQPMFDEAVEACDEKKIVGVLMVPAVRAWSGNQIFIDFMKDKWEFLASIVDKIGDVVDKVATLKNSEEALELTKVMIERMKDDSKGAGEDKDGEGDDSDKDDSGDEIKKSDKGTKKSGSDKEDDEGDAGKGEEPESEEPESEEPEPEDEKPEESDESEGKDSDEGEDEGEGKDSDKDEEKPEPGSEPEPEPEPEPESEESDDPDKSEKPEEDEPLDEGESESETPEPEEESEPDVDGSGGESSEGEDDSSSSEEDEDEGEDGEPKESAFEDFMDSIPDEDFDEAVAGALTKESTDAAVSSNYLPFTKDNDIIEKFQVKESSWNDFFLEDMEEATAVMTGPLQKNLERLILARSASRWQPGLRSGRINTSALHRLKTGDTRVFRKRVVSESRDTDVSLVVDCSGSMAGGPIRLAMIAAYALSTVLDRIGVNHEVIGFTTKGFDRMPTELREEMKRETERMGRTFSRYEAIHMPILKGFEERLSVEQRKRIAAAPHQLSLANNIDGESLEYAAQRLMAQKSTGKVMMVLSDGSPAAYGNRHEIDSHLVRTVKNLEKRGIRMIGIGIETDCVKRYYKNFAVLHEAHELPTKVMGELQKALLD